MSGLASLGLAVLLLSAVPPDAIEVAVEVDAPAGRLRLGRVTASIAFPAIDAEARADRVRVHLDAPGPVPTKWRLEVEEWDSHGRRLRSLRALHRQGHGRPPLFVDFTPKRPPVGAYVAWLEVTRGSRDEARSAVHVLPSPGASGPVPDRVLAVLPADAVDAGALELAPVVQQALRFPRASVELRGHWTPGEGAEAESRALAEAAAVALRSGLRSEVGAGGGDRLRAVALGASQPRYPNLSPRLGARNRRVEVVRVVAPVPPPKGTRRPRAEPRSLVLTIDGRTAAVPLTAAPRRALTLDLRPPAQVQAVLHDGFGARVSLRRVADTTGMVPVEVTVAGSSTAALAGPLAIRGGAHRLEAEGRGLEVEVSAPDATARWRLEARLATPVVDAPAAPSSVTVVGGGPPTRFGETGTPRGAGALVAVASGEGPPPPRLWLALADARTRTTAARVRLTVQGPDGARRQSEAWAAPALDVDAWAAWIEAEAPLEVTLAEAVEALGRAPRARLRFVVDGGSPASRRRVRARLVAWAEGAGLDGSRWAIDAGQERGRLVVRAFVEAEAALVPPSAAPLSGAAPVSEAG